MAMSVLKGTVRCIILAFLCALFANAGSEIYMSPSGDNSNIGTLASPVLTLEKCCAMAGSGGTCYLRGGRYHVSSSVVLDGLTDVNIFAYNNEIPIIDGTVIVSGGWDLLTSTQFQQRLGNKTSSDSLATFLGRGTHAFAPSTLAKWGSMVQSRL